MRKTAALISAFFFALIILLVFTFYKVNTAKALNGEKALSEFEQDADPENFFTTIEQTGPDPNLYYYYEEGLKNLYLYRMYQRIYGNNILYDDFLKDEQFISQHNVVISEHYGPYAPCEHVFILNIRAYPDDILPEETDAKGELITRHESVIGYDLELTGGQRYLVIHYSGSDYFKTLNEALADKTLQEYEVMDFLNKRNEALGLNGETQTPTETSTDTTASENTTDVPYETYDVNGDGKTDITDCIFVKRHILNISRLEELGFSAADTDKNGIIDTTDYIRIKRALMSLNELPQFKPIDTIIW